MDIAVVAKCEAATERLKEFTRLRAATEVEAALARMDIEVLAAALEEARGKIEAVRAWRRGLATQLRDGGGAILDWNTLDAILRGSKEGE